MLHMTSVTGYRVLDEVECRALGQSLSEQYRSARPFQHIVIDDFLEADLLRSVLDDFPSSEGKKFFDREQERLKFQYQPAEVSSGLVRNLFAELNSRAFLVFLQEL